MVDQCGQLCENIYLEEPSLFAESIIFDAQIDHHAVQAKADPFRRTTTAVVTNETQNENTIFSEPITAWSSDTERQ